MYEFGFSPRPAGKYIVDQCADTIHGHMQPRIVDADQELLSLTLRRQARKGQPDVPIYDSLPSVTGKYARIGLRDYLHCPDVAGETVPKQDERFDQNEYLSFRESEPLAF